jgi:dienelactone hydrolase
MKPLCRLALCTALAACVPAPLAAQAQVSRLARPLEAAAVTPEAVSVLLQQYLLAKTPALPQPASGEAWTRDSAQLRRRILDQIVFRGWPKDWIEAPAPFTDLGLVPGTRGYRLRKLRFEIVPGLFAGALLYEPENLAGKVPAVLHVNGHVGAIGKAYEPKQKRSIALARAGVLSLNVEWIGCGELTGPEYLHWMSGHLDLAGVSPLGIFYLNMRRGLDFLHDHPNADRARLGVTGLSGGGWQTIFLSALDERVAASIPVAGYATFPERLARRGEPGDYEQNPPDLLTLGDYSHLTALRAPRPTLLVYNAQDDCCFKAQLVKPGLFDDVQRFFGLYPSGGPFEFHENMDPGDHNYEADNREAMYRFLNRAFRTQIPVPEPAIVPAEIRTYDELVVGLPPKNETFVSLARRRLPATPSGGGRDALRKLLRYAPVGITHIWPVDSTRSQGVETRLLRIDYDNRLPGSATWAQSIAAAAGAPLTVILDDRGKKAAGADVAHRVNRGEQVLALDPLLIGSATPAPNNHAIYSLAIGTAGERALGLQAAQLISIARHLAPKGGVRIESRGMRTQLLALAAAALEPGVFSSVLSRDGIRSWRALYEKPVSYLDFPEVFVPDLGVHFDIPQLEALVAGLERR